MSDIRDYIRWRGDLTFGQDPLNAVDTLVFCAISYIHFDNLLKDPDRPVPLREAAAEFFALGETETRIRSRSDPELLRLAANSLRFGDARICYYRDLLIPEQDTQFAAATFLLDDGLGLITFRGTDFSIVGWKEDFNMSFQQTVPAQRLALQYTREVSQDFSGPLCLCGHSKGGNMAVFAAARSSPALQDRIQAVCNHDGPGFTDYMMGDPGYKRMVPKIHTYVPQSSVIGMLMDHEEPYTIIKSKQIGLLQHDVYNWEVIGPGFIRMEEITADSRFLNETIRTWAASMSNQERNQIVDAMFGLLEMGNVEDATEILSPRSIHRYIKILGANEGLRRLLSDEFQNFVECARLTMVQLAEQREMENPPARRRRLLRKLGEGKKFHLVSKKRQPRLPGLPEPEKAEKVSEE